MPSDITIIALVINVIVAGWLGKNIIWPWIKGGRKDRKRKDDD